ncbi:hypothetical protein [Lyngbya aestuarii]|uniref:hypothetical protein n=1 Tax=Lyngbya aestuarii TaxID=118322 RepID=UPI00403DDFF7
MAREKTLLSLLIMLLQFLCYGCFVPMVQTNSCSAAEDQVVKAHQQYTEALQQLSNGSISEKTAQELQAKLQNREEAEENAFARCYKYN